MRFSYGAPESEIAIPLENPIIALKRAYNITSANAPLFNRKSAFKNTHSVKLFLQVALN